jgi:two-component system, response regulator PhcR
MPSRWSRPLCTPPATPSHADGTASELASDLVQSVCEGYPFDADEARWVHRELRQDFRLPGHRDLIYLVLCTLVKNALLALRSALPAQPQVADRSAGWPGKRHDPCL